MGLDRKTIVAAALRLLDEKGLEGVTTRRLAEVLGVAGPSLYWHVKNKDALFDHMSDAMFGEVLQTDAAVLRARGWDEWLAAGARVIRKAALSHRDGARLLTGRHPTGAQAIAVVPGMVERLERAGFTTTEAHFAFRTLSRFTLGWALDEQAGGGAADSEAGFEFGLAVILDGLRARLATQAASAVRT
ncbi:TetR/AcrR family transcriptional regulator C-terminal domain-containing protein [Phenylobacterium sp.]|uniref:TetR/AcrR family transcriptional regulator C-terminal domain-containing protein n=1 Tax=Phenylobacterium sp. TaxID=1871053 RepID=UPI002FC78B19